MKYLRLAISVLVLGLAGCATSVAPSAGFNDWTNEVAYGHYQSNPKPSR